MTYDLTTAISECDKRIKRLDRIARQHMGPLRSETDRMEVEMARDGEYGTRAPQAGMVSYHAIHLARAERMRQFMVDVRDAIRDDPTLEYIHYIEWTDDSREFVAPHNVESVTRESDIPPTCKSVADLLHL